MSKRPRRKFTDQFKAEAVALVKASGKGPGPIARDLDLSDSALREWMKQAEGDQSRGEGPLDENERSKLKRLENEVRVLRMERDFLKKAAAFFARETT